MLSAFEAVLSIFTMDQLKLFEYEDVSETME
jgi:hypothetical protein